MKDAQLLGIIFFTIPWPPLVMAREPNTGIVSTVVEEAVVEQKASDIRMKTMGFQPANPLIRQQAAPALPYVSILLRTYNEEQWIGRCLDAILSQEVHDAARAFEIIIIDSQSTDRTLETALTFHRKRFPLKVIRIPKREFSFGMALNIGCKAAQGTIIVSLSAHAIPSDPFWLKNLIKPLEDKRIAGVYGREIPGLTCNPIEARRIYGTFGPLPKYQIRDCFFCNSNSAFKKQIWEMLRFNELLTSTEDHDWAGRVQKRGYKIFYQPSAVVIHSHNFTILQTYHRIKNNVLNKLKFIEQKSVAAIAISGIANFTCSLCYDWLYIVMKSGHPPLVVFYWLIVSIPYNLSMLSAYFSAAFTDMDGKLINNKTMNGDHETD